MTERNEQKTTDYGRASEVAGTTDDSRVAATTPLQRVEMDVTEFVYDEDAERWTICMEAKEPLDLRIIHRTPKDPNLRRGDKATIEIRANHLSYAYNNHAATREQTAEGNSNHDAGAKPSNPETPDEDEFYDQLGKAEMRGEANAIQRIALGIAGVSDEAAAGYVESEIEMLRREGLLSQDFDSLRANPSPPTQPDRPTGTIFELDLFRERMERVMGPWRLTDVETMPRETVVSLVDEWATELKTLIDNCQAQYCAPADPVWTHHYNGLQQWQARNRLTGETRDLKVETLGDITDQIDALNAAYQAGASSKDQVVEAAAAVVFASKHRAHDPIALHRLIQEDLATALNPKEANHD